MTKDGSKTLSIVGARENNLKDISTSIEHDSLTVVTGLSGSGKSSLAFDTVYAEGQRRYIETFSPYTRQFFDKVKKPDVDLIENVRPAVAIQQRTRVTNSRSTVGSMTNVNDYLKVLWCNLATPICGVCGVELRAYGAGELADLLIRLHALKPGKTLLIAVRVRLRKRAGLPQKKPKARKGKFVPGVGLEWDLETCENALRDLSALGFSRYFNTGAGGIELLDECADPGVLNRDGILLVLDRVKAHSEKPNKKRLQDSIDQTYSLADEKLPPNLLAEPICEVIELEEEVSTRRAFLTILNTPQQENQSAAAYRILSFSPSYRCPSNNFRVPKAKPSLFSFNHPVGACPECKGFGKTLAVDPHSCVPNPNLSIKEKALQCWAGPAARGEYRDLLNFCGARGISTSTPWRELPMEARDLIFNHKSKEYWGVIPWFKWLERKAYKVHVRVFLSRYRTQMDCPVCGGTRLKPEALAFQIDGRRLPDLWNMPVGQLRAWLEGLSKTMQRRGKLPRAIAETFNAVLSRLTYLCDLGLPYLTLERQARTLSGGETQRVNLATALGSDLVSTHFVLDEPSVGLHARDTERLIASIKKLSGMGNSLLVVEHDLDCIHAAENIIELGPEAGAKGGRVVYNGPASGWTPFEVAIDPGLRAPALAHEDSPKRGTGEQRPALRITNARARNLKGFDLSLPLQKFVCLTGVSGSGKSTLVNEVIKKAFDRYAIKLADETDQDLVSGFEQVGQVLLIDQSPLARSPRANIATYSGMWDVIRDLLAESDDAQVRALGKSAFSFNVDGGRCPECKGAGFIREDMQFLSDVYIPCEICLGKRFQAPILEVKYRGKNVSEILGMSLDEASRFFHHSAPVRGAAETLCILGLGHLTLGHSLSELSGCEAQRLKLVPFVQRSGQTDKSLLIFDEPTTGLHHYDVQRLIALFRMLCESGHSVLCIEHNLSLITAADWIVDLGPEGGEAGGELLAQGRPADFLNSFQDSSYTARYLQAYVDRFSKPTGRFIDVPQDGDGRNGDREPPKLILKGAREHNLKDVSVELPLDQFVAVTGVSGSGKSTIAKDIVYAEGQRRYLDCLSPYARQFIKELKKPDIDELHNIKPTICVYQHTFQPSRLSTVATMSEIYNFLRLLYAKTGTQFCPDHPDKQITPLSPRDIALEIKKMRDQNIRILAPVVKMKKGNHRAVLERAISSDITQIRVDGVFVTPSSVNLAGGLLKTKAHTIEFVVGRMNPGKVDLELVESAVEQALSLGAGNLLVLTDKTESLFSMERTCPVCKTGFFKPDPEDLSFNSRRGVCKTCLGAGRTKKGTECPECGGARINPIGRNLRLGGKSIYEAALLPPSQLLQFLDQIDFTGNGQELAEPILRELSGKAHTLISIGLDYLPLARDCATLSSGELQRLRLATAMGSPLSGVMYIFDEPSAGLHPQDNHKVLKLLKDLKARGNSVLVIEHDPESILAADHVLDIGPGGGKQGGAIVFNGDLRRFLEDESSLTASALRTTPTLNPGSKGNGARTLEIRGGSVNNIRGLDLSIPLGKLVAIAGVSGAGKSSLVHGIISDTILHGTGGKTAWKSDTGRVTTSVEIARLLEVDQKPIGINSRSTPASYLKIWDEIRKLFASTNEARARGWPVGFFSYNSGKGRCPECKGLGQIRLEMSFLPDAEVVCETCGGARYTEEAQTVHYLGLSVSDALGLTFDEARAVFANHRKIHRALHLACELGLGYLTLGQSSTTLSGGESQRIKLVSELSTTRKGHTLYILDEPTTGLHKSDVARLLRTLGELVARGNSVIVIEHDADLVLGADWLIEFGPGAGVDGGRVIYQGAPAGLKKAKTPWGSIVKQPGEPLRRELARSAAFD